MRSRLLLAFVVVLLGVASQAPPSGRVRLAGHGVADDRGVFPALGGTLFWAAWGYKHDRPRLDAALKLLADHRFDYIRALGIVGRQPYWSGREIDWRWPDYTEVIAGLTDYAYDRFGLRVEWTIFADADQVIPNPEDRVKLIDTFIAMSRGREHKIMHFEVANESWQNGFGGPDGIAQIRQLAKRLTEATDIPVAISDSEGHECGDHLALYKDTGADIQTEHFSRDLGGPLRGWGPVIAPWSVRECAGLPTVVSNNEPVGPKSSIASESDPMRIIGGATASYMAGVGLYVFHTDAGVWGRTAISDMPNAAAILDGFAAMKAYLPADIVNWRRHRHDSKESPFIPYAGKARGAIWPDGHDNGAAEVLGSDQDGRFFVLPIGIVNGLTLEARRNMEFDVLHPLTGVKLEHHALKPGETVRPRPLQVIVISGRFTDGGTGGREDGGT
ncbi:MAG: hypothetical protein WBC51_23270 [Vicinamibacterales bacterium]